jgi:hypothetical protein
MPFYRELATLPGRFNPASGALATVYDGPMTLGNGFHNAAVRLS